MTYTIQQLATELTKPEYADEVATLRAAIDAYQADDGHWHDVLMPPWQTEHDQWQKQMDAFTLAKAQGVANLGDPPAEPEPPVRPSRYWNTDPLQQLLNAPAAARRPPSPWDGTTLGMGLDMSEIDALPGFAQNVLIKLMDKQIDLANPTVLLRLQGILATCPNSLKTLTADAAPVPCTPIEALGNWGDVAQHNEVLAAIGVAV